VTPSTFLKLFPEFNRTSPNVVSARLMLAEVEMGGPDFSVWPAFATSDPNTGQANQPLSITDLAHGYLTAHLLQTSPMGAPTRLAPEGTDGRSSYLDRFEALCRAVACGPLVAGTNATSTATGLFGQLSFNAGLGKVALVNGSTQITFSLVQTLPVGTLFVFVGAQPGVIYTLSANMSGLYGVLTSQYTGVSNPSSAWNLGAF
jgi:hypothetical protein